MTTKSSFLLILVVVILAIVIWWWWKRRSATPAPTYKVEAHAPAPSVALNPAPGVEAKLVPPAVTAAAPAAAVTRPVKPDDLEIIGALGRRLPVS